MSSSRNVVSARIRDVELKLPEDSARRRPEETPAARGEMARRFREFDWSATPIGPVEFWPESWRHAVQIILDSSFPTAIGLGKELIYFYNDAFIPLAGASRHPAALGLPVPVAWKEIWNEILLPRFTHTLTTGEPTGEADLLMPLERSGYLEETYLTFSFAALRDDKNQPNGIFCTAIENTARVIAERQINCLRALAARSSLAETPEAACQSAVATLEGNPRDLPFALLYLLDKDGKRAHVAGTAGLISLPRGITETIDFADTPTCAIARVAASRTAVLIDDIQHVIQGLVRTPEVTPQQALALPVLNPGGEHLAAVLIAGVNPMRPLDESRAFHELIANHLETAISSARAKQHVRERAQALAELDRAKTVFFSNISHELRTPLTLLLAPLDDLLARTTLEDADRSLLEIARRGGARLLKLVNSLLEFSRIEAGRIEASYEATDLAGLTMDLASVFRSAFERAGVALTLDCPKLPDDVYVDRDMWEKIVLNLVSNAFKFTFKGEVRVSQQALGDHIELQVSDTGCGVAAEDLPRLFERFFRGRTTQARTHEGSGIGLSLVQELVKLHGGSIEARSEVGVGTAITLRIPRGSAHLPTERIGRMRTLERARIGALPFVEEALGWLPDGGSAAFNPESGEATSTSESETPRAADAAQARILIVDDNADMRGYLRHLLGGRWQVETAPDGVVAMEHIRQRLPDLVIADVMMPVMDGFGLLSAIRANTASEKLPVMLLSARAGEEASSEGLRAGADDYVIKPFSARELLARVESRLAQARLHAAERRARETAEQANRARDIFFTMLSHELRTPLMAVLAWTALLKDNRLDPSEAVHALELIDRNARVQRRLVDDLLDISRIVTGRLRIDPRPVASLAQMVGIVVDSFRPAALAKNLTVETALESGAGTVNGDLERLQQVVWNLLSNAIRFTPPGGRIQLRYARCGEHVELLVRDSGQGIAPEELPHLFERYWQGVSRERRSQGLGLGLAIAHRIIELHGGSIAAASEGEGQGATFTVTLPLHTPDSQPIADDGTETADLDATAAANSRMLDAATSELEVASSTAHLHELPMKSDDSGAPHALRILLVEDHEGVAKACRRLLTSHGHFVVCVPSLAAATTVGERATFDLAICDLSLPDGSGIELLPRMRSRFARLGSNGQVPAIAMSGSVYDEDVARSLQAGFAAHLAKPFDEESLLAAVRNVTEMLAW
ncbi:MAG: multi-sensor hybrid histidine kinase [Gammaproteobacteria bacterium]|nr:multi-sensor hybrid histidine kinase [Gammaproteobacteria bacterium]